MKILIVDDNEDSRMILRKTLEHDGYSVDEAPNGVEALKQAEKSTPDMIVSDILMPEMDGFRFCRKIKQDNKLRDIPFIFYTSTYTDPKNEKLAMSLGAARYIIKPVAIDEFLEAIREMSSSIKEKAMDSDKATIEKGDDLLEMYEDSIVAKLDKKVRELQLYKEIFANSNDAIFVMDTKGRIIQQNSAHRVLTGYTSDEFKGKTPALYLGKKVFSDITKKLSLMGVYRGDLIVASKEGGPVHIELSAFSIADEKGVVTSHIGIERDITKRKLAEMEIRRSAENVEQTFISTITSLASILDAKSPWTKGHAERVRDYAVAIGKKMGLDKSSIDSLRLGGLFHDIGKIGTFDIILDKPDKLTPDELKLMQLHPSKGAEILSPIRQLKDVVPIIKYHHEKIDGTGYPEGLKNDEIPLLAKIVCVADAYDSIVANRPYRKPTNKKDAIEEIKRSSGTHFDPLVVDAFIEVMKAGKIVHRQNT